MIKEEEAEPQWARALRRAQEAADADRRRADDRFEANQKSILENSESLRAAVAELAGQKARIDEVEKRVDQLQANNLNEEKFAEKFAGVQEVLQQEMSSAAARIRGDFTTLNEEVTARVDELEEKMKGGGNSRSEEGTAELQK